MQGYRKEEAFELPVVYDHKEILFPARLVQMGYSYKIYVNIDGQDIIYEPDEERNFRAVIDTEKTTAAVPVSLIRAICESLEQNLK